VLADELLGRGELGGELGGELALVELTLIPGLELERGLRIGVGAFNLEGELEGELEGLTLEALGLRRGTGTTELLIVLTLEGLELERELEGLTLTFDDLGVRLGESLLGGLTRTGLRSELRSELLTGLGVRTLGIVAPDKVSLSG